SSLDRIWRQPAMPQTVGLIAMLGTDNDVPGGSIVFARVTALLTLVAMSACASSPAAPAVSTIEPGVLKIAVTGTTTDVLDPQSWMYGYAERLASDMGLSADWHIVPFDKSWELAGKDVVDLVATNLASFPDRVSAGGTFSAPFLYEQRALRVRAAD